MRLSRASTGISLIKVVRSVGQTFYFQPTHFTHPYQTYRETCAMAGSNIWNSGLHNPAWAAVDEYAFSHSHPASRPNTQALRDTLETSRAACLPDYAVSPAQGKFLALHCRAAGVTHALEVGTLGGYAAIWLASENPQLRLTTVEHNLRHVEVARRNIAAAGLSDRVEVVHGAGVDVLTRLRDEVVRSRTRTPFGFVFIDADKHNSWNYVKLAKDMVRPNSVICVDNVVREGDLADPANTDPYVVASRQVVEKVAKEPGLDSVVMQMVGEKSYDGWLWVLVS